LDDKGKGRAHCISVVKMGGQGKTTLVKKALDNKVVIGHFDCVVWITVSQAYNVEGLLRDDYSLTSVPICRLVIIRTLVRMGLYP
jgi:hypothetical protein